MDETTDFPVKVDKAFLEALSRVFPERCPSMQWSDRKVWVEVGKRDVIRFLTRVYNEQNPESQVKGE